MKATTIALISLVFSALASAGQPVASVTSSAPFDLAGNHVNVGGVPSWTVMSGDDIATSSGQATIQLRDGSRLILLANSRVRVSSDGDSFSVRLVSGALEVLSALPDFRLYVPDGQTSAVPGAVVSVGTPASKSAAIGSSGLNPLVPRPVSRR